MRTVTVDGIKCEVHSCLDCPCCEVDDYGVPSECNHPLNSEVSIYHPDEDGQQEIIRHGGKASVDRCPLKEAVNEEVHRPCPFCGSTSLSEIYVDDTGEILEEWMMDEVNKGMDENDQYMTLQEFYDAAACHFLIQCTICGCNIESPLSMKDAWAKWNRRAEE